MYEQKVVDDGGKNLFPGVFRVPDIFLGNVVLNSLFIKEFLGEKFPPVSHSHREPYTVFVVVHRFISIICIIRGLD